MKSPSWMAVFFLALLLGFSLAGCSSMPSKAAAPDLNATTTAADATQPAPFSTKDAENSSAKKGLLPSSLVPASLTVPAGTPVSIRLQSSVSSRSARAGDSFEAVLDEPLVIDGKTVAQRGTTVRGRVVDAKPSGRLHSSGYLRLTLASIELGGKDVPLQTSSVFARGANHNKRNLTLIGGGAGVGALIGGLAGGGKGALIGSAVGAGAGTGGAYATGEKDVAFGAERRLTFRLTQPLTSKG